MGIGMVEVINNVSLVPLFYIFYFTFGFSLVFVSIFIFIGRRYGSPRGVLVLVLVLKGLEQFSDASFKFMIRI